MDRYQKQIILEEIGIEGQEALRQASVCIIGCGGLGAIAAMYLAGAGIGKIRLIDFDTPDVTNLHRQVFYNVKEGGTKADQLSVRITKLNPEVQTEVRNIRVNKANMESCVSNTDVVLDCTDDIFAKYLINDFTALRGIPLAYASIHKFVGYASMFNTQNENGGQGANLRHFFPSASSFSIPSCSDIGAYNALAGIFGLIQANECLKFLLGLPVLVNTLLIMDVRDYSQQKIKLDPSRKIDIKHLWNSNNYEAFRCADDLRIDLNTWHSMKQDGKIVSILETDEKDEINLADAHFPLSQFDQWEDKLELDKPYLFYCRSGKRSDELVGALNDKYPEAQFYSLEIKSE